jgi:hypothetical protein
MLASPSPNSLWCQAQLLVAQHARETLVEKLKEVPKAAEEKENVGAFQAHARSVVRSCVYAILYHTSCLAHPPNPSER